LANIW